ncbi:MAG TPA: tetratricopeptide repeat protein [Vicinamibacteria bacterium]|nr:tetratricopeptide repeat protein [Vicinamibacteria bacterium]
MPVVALFPLVLLLASPAGQASSAPAEGFEALARRAGEARDALRTPEALDLYRRAVAARADWDEGWWYLGVLLYESRRCEEAEPAFARFLELKPQTGAGWVIRGVCAFDRGDHPQAVEWIQKGVDLGLGGNAELQRMAAARLAFALVKIGRFELAIQPLTLLSRLSAEEPGLVEATGLALLRLPLLPSEVPAERRELVQKLGSAGSLHLARRGDEAAKAYEELVAAYPNEPRARYAYGVFLLRSGDDKGLAELRRAVELDPGDVMARLELAFELLLHGDHAEAKEHALKAVAQAPSLFAAHNALGRALVELGELDAGIRELEEAVRLAPESPETHFSLARAYARAGRTEDAARERAAFTEIEERRRAAPAAAPAADPARQ